MFFCFFFCAKSGSYPDQLCRFFGCGGWNEQEMDTCFSTFFNASKPQRTALTYSVMIQREKYCRLCDPFQIFEFWVGMGIAFTKCFSIPLGALASIWQEKMVLAIPPQTSGSFLTSNSDQQNKKMVSSVFWNFAGGQCKLNPVPCLTVCYCTVAQVFSDQWSAGSILEFNFNFSDWWSASSSSSNSIFNPSICLTCHSLVVKQMKYVWNLSRKH